MALVVASALPGCADVGTAGGGVGGFPESWGVSRQPAIEIGVVEGLDPYQLHKVRGTARFPGDGSIVVLNSGSRELRYYDSQGAFLFAAGGEGEGPGEFMAPSRMRLLNDRSVVVWDEGLRRNSVFDRDGRFLRSWPVQWDPEQPFPLDEWIFRNTFIDSPLAPEQRAIVRHALRGIGRDTTLAFRFAKVTQQGRLWLRLPSGGEDAPSQWAVYNLDGFPIARVALPPRFEPGQIGPDFVLGVFRDELDVEYVHQYPLFRPDSTRTDADLFSLVRSSLPGFGGADAQPPVDPEVARSTLTEVVIGLASAQEIHYSSHLRYARDVSALNTELPEAVSVRFLWADADGWTGTAELKGSNIRCGISYGSPVLMGWQPGGVACFPEDR